MKKYKKLEEESDRTLLIDSYISSIPSYREMIFITWMAGWFYLDIYKILWWVIIGFMVLGLLVNRTPFLPSKSREELKKRGYK